MRPVIIVESLPLLQFSLQVYIVGVGKGLVELALIGAVRALDLAI